MKRGRYSEKEASGLHLIHTDLIEERQAAVQAILNAGHIPAGMELFSAGDESQLETVKRWIDESDVFLLILGGRYGSIEPKTKQGYVEVEYDYAVQTKTPAFAVVMSEKWTHERMKQLGKEAVEMNNQDMYNKFRKRVLSKICRIADDSKDIKIAVHETLHDFILRHKFDGWVSGKEIAESSKALEQLAEMIKENKLLRAKLDKLTEQNGQEARISGLRYSELKSILENHEVKMPKGESDEEVLIMSLLDAFVRTRKPLAAGVANSLNSSKMESLAFREIASPLLAYGLVERAKVPGVRFVTLQLSNEGGKFLSTYDLEQLKEKGKLQ